MEKILVAGLAVMALAVGTLGCQGNDAIPKLVPVEQFESGKRVETLGDALVFTTPKVDILFVIDNSGSMGGFQKRLSTNIELFLEELGKVDRLSYRVGVVTSGDPYVANSGYQGGNLPTHVPLPASTGLGRFYKPDPLEPDYISSTTRDGLLLLRNRLVPGVNGNPTEVFFETVLNALTDPAQSDFVRSDAHLAVIFLTDAEDVSRTVTADTLMAGLLAIKGHESKILTYGALIPSGLTNLELNTRDGCRRDDQGPPVNIERFIEAFKGKVFDICSDDFGIELAKIGRDLGNAVGQASVLVDVPDPTTIRVFAGDLEIPNDPVTGWIYLPETNEIIFGDELMLDDSSSDAKIMVTYTSATHFHN